MSEVVFTGFGEPACRFNTVLCITAWLHKKGVLVRDWIRTAMLHSCNPGRDVAAELKVAGLHAVSVSLNAESEESTTGSAGPLWRVHPRRFSISRKRL